MNIALVVGWTLSIFALAGAFVVIFNIEDKRDRAERETLNNRIQAPDVVRAGIVNSLFSEPEKATDFPHEWGDDQSFADDPDMAHLGD